MSWACLVLADCLPRAFPPLDGIKSGALYFCLDVFFSREPVSTLWLRRYLGHASRAPHACASIACSNWCRLARHVDAWTFFPLPLCFRLETTPIVRRRSMTGTACADFALALPDRWLPLKNNRSSSCRSLARGLSGRNRTSPRTYGWKLQFIRLLTILMSIVPSRWERKRD